VELEFRGEQKWHDCMGNEYLLTIQNNVMDELTGTSYRKCRAQNRLSTTALARVYNAVKYCTRVRSAHCTKVVTKQNDKIFKYAFCCIDII